MAVTESALQVPLCVDLDGTLINSDVLFESILLLIKRNPLYLLRMMVWVLKGKAAFKAEIASRVTVNPAALPYNQALLDWLGAQRASGRSLWLVTATNERFAKAVAEHLDIFDGVIASDGSANVAGDVKAARLVDRFGARNFDYAGNEHRDLLVWKHANGAIVTNGKPGLERAAADVCSIVNVFPRKGSFLRAAVRALRPHQWAKNGLIFVPLFAAHRAADATSALNVVFATIAFCACASSVYVLNDLLDLEADRAHRRKRLRPFASGALPIWAGMVMAPVLLLIGVLLALALPEKFQLVFASYYILTCAYSFGLKALVVVDAMALAGLYTLRIISGAAAALVPLSFWLLLFSVFIFLSLALVKRYAELDSLRRQQRLRAAGRGYHVEDLAVLQSLGTSAGYLSVLVLALYINSPEVAALYERPKMIWMLCVLILYWVSRIWMKTHRGEMHDDPVVFALKDRISLVIAVLGVIAIALAI
jgi:4-hydroxybenzoate polyprenyltransferase/phosphoserine phosphatase